MYNGYTKDLDAETQRKNEIETVTKFVQENPENEYWQNRYNELVIKPMYGEDWEQSADALRNILDNEGLSPSYKRFQEANKPNEDAVDVGI